MHGYHRFRRYAPRMLRVLDIQNAPVAAPLTKAAKIIAEDQASAPRQTAFLRRNSKWHRHLNAQEPGDNRLSIAHQSFYRTSHRSDGRISSSRANTGGKIDDIWP